MACLQQHSRDFSAEQMSATLVRAVLRAAPVDVAVRVANICARDGTLERALRCLADTPHLPDPNYMRSVVSRLLPLVPLDEGLGDPLYELAARCTGDATGGILTYFIDRTHPLCPSESALDDGSVRVWTSRYLSDISTRVWPAAFSLASAMAMLLVRRLPEDLCDAPLQVASAKPAVLIELGAGTGLASLLVARALKQASAGAVYPTAAHELRIIATDGDRAGVQRCFENISLNAWVHRDPVVRGPTVEAAVLEWSAVSCACSRRNECDAVPKDEAATLLVASADGASKHDHSLTTAPAAQEANGAMIEAPMPSLSPALCAQASVLFGSDLVYSHDAIEPLARVLCAFVHCGASDCSCAPPPSSGGALDDTPLPDVFCSDVDSAARILGILMGRGMDCGGVESSQTCPRAGRFAVLSNTRRNAETYALFVRTLARHRLAYVDATDAFFGRRVAGETSEAGGVASWASPLVDLCNGVEVTDGGMVSDVRTALILPAHALQRALSGAAGRSCD